jgi:hypothetical protein
MENGIEGETLGTFSASLTLLSAVYQELFFMWHLAV